MNLLTKIKNYLFTPKPKEHITKEYLKKQRRLAQLSEDLAELGLLKMRVTDDYNMVSQYYGNEDDTKLNINNL